MRASAVSIALRSTTDFRPGIGTHNRALTEAKPRAMAGRQVTVRVGGDFACIVDPVQRGELGFEILYASDREGLTHHRPQTLLLMIEAMFADVHMSVLHNGKTI